MGTGMKHLLTQLGVYASSPVAFLVLILYAALWYVLSRKPSSGTREQPWQRGP
jgi:hypothetical protein